MRLFLSYIIGTVFVTLVSSVLIAEVAAQDGVVEPKQEYAEAEITQIVEEDGQTYAEVKYSSGSRAGEDDRVLVLTDPKSQDLEYQTGDSVIVLTTTTPEGNTSSYITDKMRTSPLIILFGIFVLIALLIGRWNGALSILGMIYSFGIIGRFVLPNIILGNNPVFVSILGGMLIAPVTFYLSHGFKWKTTAAILGTILSLLVTGILAAIFISYGRLSGADSDEALFVQALINTDINLQSLLLAGIIIGSLGILDDITVSQAAIVKKLIDTNKHMSFKEVFFHSMDVGRDHIASLVNTLILVYAGAALPLFLLFYNNELPFSIALSTEIVAIEIIKMLVGSIGLITAVPITTVIALFILIRKK
ncbi:MAG: YibE/F family protein [Patescibacteria group bacterium]